MPYEKCKITPKWSQKWYRYLLYTYLVLCILLLKQVIRPPIKYEAHSTKRRQNDVFACVVRLILIMYIQILEVFFFLPTLDGNIILCWYCFDTETVLTFPPKGVCVLFQTKSIVFVLHISACGRHGSLSSVSPALPRVISGVCGGGETGHNFCL